MEITNPHDKFFKETFSVQGNVIDFLQGTLPKDILKKLDLSALTLDSNTYIDEELKEHFSDMVYSCVCKNTELKIALLFEHKSYPVAYPHLQLLKYLLKIWGTNVKQGVSLTPVIPVILYHGKETWQVRRLTECFEGIDEVFFRFIPEFEYLLTDLSRYTNEEIKDKVFKKASLEIALLLMRNVFNEVELEKNLSSFFEIGKQYFEEEEGLRFLESVVRYLYNTTEIEAGKIVNTVKQLSEKGGGFVMTTAMKLIEQGKVEGRAEGRVEGKLEGLKEAITLGLELKYGTEGLNLCEKIATIVSLEKLEMIKKTVKTSKKLKEIERLL